MQIEIDLTSYELEHLKRKIDELDPVTQSEEVLKYLGRNYTQKQLGEKLGKTRDWIAKRVQFIRALEKLPKSEQEERKNLVRHHTISMDVVILVANLPQEQRQQIISKHPTVAEARRLVHELSQKDDSELTHDELAQLVYSLDKRLPKIYKQLEEATQGIIGLAWEGGMLYAPPEVERQRILEFNKEYWDENYQFGRMSQIGLELSEYQTREKEHLLARLAFLRAPEYQRLNHLKELKFVTHYHQP